MINTVTTLLITHTGDHIIQILVILDLMWGDTDTIILLMVTVHMIVHTEDPTILNMAIHHPIPTVDRTTTANNYIKREVYDGKHNDK